MKKINIFYGWWIVGVSMLIMATAFSLRINCMSLFVVPVTQGLNITRSQFSVVSLIASVLGMLLSPAAGKLLARHNIRYIMTAAAAVFALSYSSFALAGNALHMYLSAVGLGASFAFLANLPVTILMNRWFVKARSTAISLAFVGGSIGTMILSPVITALMASVGWRVTYGILGGVTALLLVPSILLVVRSGPEEMGLEPLGAGEAIPGRTTQHQSEGLRLAQLQRTGVFWVFLGGLVFIVLTLGCLYHMPAHVMDIGFSAETAAKFVSAYSFVAIFGKLIMGAVFDKLGLFAGALLGTATMLGTFVFLLLARNIPLLLVVALCYGIGSACGTVLPPVMVGRMFGSKYYGENYGFVHAFVTLSMGVNNMLFAAAYDLTGDYASAWTGGALLCVGSTLLFVWAVRCSRNLLCNGNRTSATPAAVRAE